MKSFLNISDLHYGFERRSGHKTALHDPKAMDVALQFASDFKPDTLILNGDILDCGVISHHNKKKPGRTEGLRLKADAEGLTDEFMKPLASMGIRKKVYLIGNHEDWINDLIEENPGIEGYVELESMLDLDDYEVIPQGGYYNLGKLTFLHGDTLSGGEQVAKSAVTAYERSIRIGHFHTHQVYTKTTPVDYKFAKSGMACPCLCTRSPKYGEAKPNRWVQGVNYGYVFPDGTYADFVSIIINGRMVANGKTYKG